MTHRTASLTSYRMIAGLLGIMLACTLGVSLAAADTSAGDEAPSLTVPASLAVEMLAMALAHEQAAVETTSYEALAPHEALTGITSHERPLVASYEEVRRHRRGTLRGDGGTMSYVDGDTDSTGSSTTRTGRSDAGRLRG